ncbi:ABC transporter substrate-binding protein [Streptomyces sp. NPDC001380]|uniref:ABC transporter substrate-binding protein n=1 Tax=Streptomyces sp. NPDC001380 TaxID=3364566 RepID=UPI0036C65E9A
MRRLGSTGSSTTTGTAGRQRGSGVPGRGRRLAGALATGALALPAALGAAGCGGPADAATSSDITVMTWAPSGTSGADRPGMTALAEAIGRQVNASGGVAGRRLRVLTCNEHDTSAGADACTQQAVREGAVAVVGSYSQYGAAILPTLESHGIPYIGGYGLSSAEFQSPDSYPVNGGTPALLAGSGRQLLTEGCRSVSVVRPDTQAGDVMFTYLSRALTPAGITPVDIPAPEQSTDYGTVAERAVGDDRSGHCVTVALAAVPTQNFLDAYRQQRHRRTRLSSVIGSFQQSVVDATGGAGGPLGSAYAASWYPAESSRVWDPLRRTATAYGSGDSGIDASDPGVQTTWVAYQVFLETVRRLGPQVGARALGTALSTQAPVATGGATPPLAWRLTDMLASMDTPRLVNTAVTFQAVRDGQFTDQRHGFVDVGWVLTGSGRAGGS